MATTILTVQHHEDSPAGLVGEGVERVGGRLAILRGDRHEPLPEGPAGFDGLLLLGGAMSANDDAGYPHFPALLALIRAFLEDGKPVLGLCLGAQLLARAHGATVRPMPAVEFGFVPLTLTGAGRRDPLLIGLGNAPVLMQYHEDGFDLPDSAELLLTGAFCRNQGFRLGVAYGFQCHLEVTAGTVRAWAELRAAQLGVEPAPLRRKLEAQMARYMPAAERFGRALGTRWLALARRRAAA